jgi:hypothetical protein
VTCSALDCRASATAFATSDVRPGQVQRWTLLCEGCLDYLRRAGEPPLRPDQVVPFDRDAWRASLAG